MCSNYTLTVRGQELRELLKKDNLKIDDIDHRFLPYQAAPVIVRLSDSTYKVAAMKFSLVPSWSKEPKVKFATHNARVETVTEKPTWKTPFVKHHCIVPMTGFYESAYEGPLAGNIIKFSENQNHLLFAAGIFDHWTDPETKNVSQSFSVLTTSPTKYIEDYGHDRSPIFLKKETAFDWLNVSGQSDRYWLDFLNTESVRPDLKVVIDRPLKPGWEKRK